MSAPVTLDSVREELRTCVMHLNILGRIGPTHPKLKEAAEETLNNLLAFACNSGLFCREEYDDWKQAMVDGVSIKPLRKWSEDFKRMALAGKDADK